jgi:ATP-dependent exoDNAse (exonuclease V) beta subunit
VERRLRVSVDLPVRGRRDVTRLADAEGCLPGPDGLSFTPEQADAVRRREGSLLLTANAGSGKTSVLVERFVRSVTEDGLRPGDILAITFTEKAAGELRARIRGRFLQLGRRDDAREAEGAWISTIHGFCARVLRAHAIAAGLDPRFVVLDEPVARALRRRAFERALAAFLGDPEGAGPERAAALELVAAYTPERLERMVCGVHDELRSQGQTRPSLPAPEPADLARTRAELAAAVAAAETHLEGATRSLPTIDDARAAVRRCRELLASAGQVPGRRALEGLAFGPGQVAELRAPAVARYLDARAAFAQACADARAVPAVALVDELLGHYADAYAELKRERSGLDFSDLELATRDLFAAAPAVADGYAERFARIMVDEFQDTNPLQLELVDRLDRDDVFLVGDELQAIYGFRHADVRGFQRRRRAHEAAGTAAALATNFRSHPQILATLNAAFGPAHGAGYVPLRPGRDDPPPAAPRVELLLVDAPAWDEGDAPPPGGTDGELGAPKPSLAVEAALVAGRVRELVDAGDCAAGGVVVLLRAVADMPVFERALERAGFATLSAAGRGWWGRREVLDLTAHLGALANPRDEVALLGMLTSPLVGVSSDGLALLAMAGRASGGLWAAAEAAFCAGEAAGGDGLAARLPAADRERLAAFSAWFASERRVAPRRGLSELIGRAVDRSGYDEHVLRLSGGRRRLANVHKLMRLADAYEAREGRDIRGFIDHARAELDAGGAESDAPVELGDQDAVRLMTIHAAKGLEFRVVVVAQLGRAGNDRCGDLLVRDGRLGLRLVAVDGSSDRALAYDGIRDDLRRAEADEERRIMHVAMTRAQDRLILSGAFDPLKGWPSQRHGACPLASVGPALVPEPASAVSRDDPVAELAVGQGAVRVVLHAPAPPTVHGEQLALDFAAAPAAPDAARTQGAEPLAAAPPPAAPRPAGGLSYSGLASYAACPYRFYLQRVLGLPEQEAPPGLEPEADGVDARLRGTLAHELLERLDLAAGAPPPGRDAVAALGAAHGVELTTVEIDDLLALVGAFAGGELRARLGRAASVRREHPFAFPLDPGDASGPLLNGVVDVLAFEASGEALVVDYKTDRVGDADLEALVEAHYGAQRRIYALAALRSGAPAVEVVHLFLAPRESGPAETVTARFTSTDATALAHDLRTLAAGLLAGDYPVTSTPHAALCATCPGRDGLCSWPPSMTDRVRD